MFRQTCWEWTIDNKFIKQISTSSITLGSRSTKTALGTCLPEPHSEKKVLKLSSAWPMLASVGIIPSGWIPCSRQYSSLHTVQYSTVQYRSRAPDNTAPCIQYSTVHIPCSRQYSSLHTVQYSTVHIPCSRRYSSLHTTYQVFLNYYWNLFERFLFEVRIGLYYKIPFEAVLWLSSVGLWSLQWQI